MIQKEKDIKDIIDRIGWWVATIPLANAAAYFDGNKVAETFVLPLLNSIYSYQLTNLNDQKVNFPGMDLGDDNGALVAFQVTSRTDAAKIMNTLRTVVKNGLEKRFPNGIKFLILKNEKVVFNKTEKTNPKNILASFNEDTDMLYPADLIKGIEQLYDADYAEFLKVKTLIEREITFPVQPAPDPFAAFMPMFQALQQQLQELSQLPASSISTAAPFLMGLELPKLRVMSHRKVIVDGINDRLKQESIVWLSGEVATGKTHVAYLLAEQHPGKAYWLDLNGLAARLMPTEFLRNFQAALLLTEAGNSVMALDPIFQQLPAGSLIVLNDLDALGGSVQAEKFISELFYAIIAGGHLLVVTSNFSPPVNLSENFEGQLYWFTLPAFTDVEVKEVLIGYGAPAADAGRIDGVVRFIAEGHPLIVNAIARYLRDNNWRMEEQTLESLFKNNYGLALNQEIYNRLLHSTADEQTRELLYRLKLVIGSFSADDLSIVSNVAPVVNHVDERISGMTGTWVQQSQKQEYQLSPLIKRIPDNLNATLRANLFEALAKGQLAKKALSAFETAKAIQYFQNAGLAQDSAMVLMRALEQLKDSPELFFDFGLALYWYYGPIPDDVNIYIRVNIRFLQVHIALALKDDITFLKNDLVNLQQNADLIDYGKGMISLTLFRLNAESEPMTALHNLIDAKNKLFNDPEMEPGAGHDDAFITQGIWITFYKLNAHQYKEWFENVAGLNLDVSVFDPVTNPAYAAAGPTILIKLTGEDFKGDTREKIEILKQVYSQAHELGMFLLSAYALKYLIYFYCFELKDFDAARKIIPAHAELLARHEIYRFLVSDEIGRHLVDADEIAEAIQLLGSIESIVLPPNYSEKPGSLRGYALAIAATDPHAAHISTLRALDTALSNQFNSSLERSQLYGEAGISHWLKGEPVEAIAMLEKGYELLNETFKNSDGYRAGVIRYGSIGQYIIREMIDGEPPTQTINGKYAVPDRGDFFETYEPAMVGASYFEERRFIVPFIFQEAFEYLGERLKAKKWGLTALQIAMSIDNAQWLVVLEKNLFYLVEEGDFDQVYSVFNYLNRDVPLEARGGQDKITEADKQKKKEIADHIRSDDTIFYEYVFIPVVYQVIFDLVTGKFIASELPELLTKVFESPNLKVIEPETLSYIKNMVYAILISGVNRRELDQLIAGYSGNYAPQVTVIASLTFSYVGSLLDAAELQLATIQRQEQVFSAFAQSGLRYHIIPFYEAFWLAKYGQQSQSSRDHEFWLEKSVPYFQQAPINTKLSRLFKVLVHHLNIKTSPAIDQWLDS